MDQEHKNRELAELYKVLASLKNEEEIKTFLGDLCTFKELEQMSQRLSGAILLLKGMTYTQVTSTTEISTATLSRVSRCIQYGTGGYRDLLTRYMKDKENDN